MKAFADDKTNCDSKIEIRFAMSEKYFGEKNEKECRLPSSAPFSIMFQKASISGSLKLRTVQLKVKAITSSF